MKKRLLSLLLAVLMILPITAQLIVPVSFAEGESGYSACIEGADTPMAQFAADEIAAALAKKEISLSDSGADWTIRFLPVNEALGEQCYEIRISDKLIEIAGGDANGLMYGGLEVAEQIEIYGINGVYSSKDSPSVRQRGFYLNIPLDMRIPAYNSVGDAGLNNIANAWDIDMWHGFVDSIARNRYNTIQMASLNPFPVMVKVDGYEDIALDDVWRSVVPLDNNYKGDMTNAVRPEDWENYEVVRTMTIDEKIAFWKDVMAYAKDRGVDFYIEIHSIYTYGEQGKYGITNDRENPVTVDYLNKSTKALIETYPDLAGMFVTNGENMGWDRSENAIHGTFQWIHDVYVPAVNDALQEDREFNFVICHTYPDPYYEEMFSDLECTLSFFLEYSSVHMYATSHPTKLNKVAKGLEDNSNFILLFRNEDCFNMRWGDPDFMMEFINNLPAAKISGCMTGSDGYCYLRDYSSTDPDFQGQLYIDKHWYNYMMIGRIMYDFELSKERIREIFINHFSGMSDADLLFEATSEAGKIIPQVDELYFQDNGDYTWFVEGCWSHPSTFGYIDIKRWMKSSNILSDGNAMSIEEYALRIANADNNPYTTVTPEEISEILAGYGNDVLDMIEKMRTGETASVKMSFPEKEFWALVSDDEAMAYLGLYYSEKITGAVELRVFNETQETCWQDSSVAHLEKAAHYWQKYAGIISLNYVPQHLARVGYFNVADITSGVLKDIETAQKWKPKRITSSVYAPSNTEYFNKDG